MDKFGVLKKYFGYDSFRSGQEELIDSILSGRDTVGVMPTGAGKSVCFQVPALLFPGVTVVVSPLISLMKDQVSALLQNSIPAAYINSAMSANEQTFTLREALRGKYKILYVAPERLVSRSFLEMCSMLSVSLVCVDEAHCVSQWGQDFRPSYLAVRDFIAAFEARPVVCAFTATATERVRHDMVKLLGLKKPFVSVLGFDRPNLYFEVAKPLNKFTALKRYLELFSGKSGIIYCATRKKTDELYAVLSSEGYSVTEYHAGLDKDIRKRNQELFINDKKEIVIATNAFGMGIDKSNVSFVIHYNMPGDVESYYQEAGRAGRDGSEAFCILLYSGEDIATQRYFIDHTQENEELSALDALNLRRTKLKKLGAMIEYCENARCLRHYILSYFGESSPERCENCSFCTGELSGKDVTVTAQKVLSCVFRVREKEPATVISRLMKGERDEYIVSVGYDRLSTFGLLEDMPMKSIEDFIAYLLSADCLFEDEKGALHLTERAHAVLFRSMRLRQKRPREKRESAEKNTGFDGALYGKLHKLRRMLAAKQSIPPFTVFTDATLRKIAQNKPRTHEEFAAVPGVSAEKERKYADAFLKLINEHSEHIEKSKRK